MSTPATSSIPSGLKKTLGPLMLWGLGVGLVISGEYFGWNLSLPAAGPVGLLVATGMITLMYLCFVLSYSELTCAMPKAGGVFVYGTRAVGKKFGMLGGMAQLMEFLFCPPAISLAIGAYMNIYFPNVDVMVFAIAAYAVFTLINIWGVKQSAVFELVITVLAVLELLIFCGVTAPSFSWNMFTFTSAESAASIPPWYLGAFAAIPGAIWFFVAIEGLANSAEETRAPQQRNISIGYISAIVTLVLLAVATLFCATGVGGWEKIVYPMGANGALDMTTTSDKPLPLALSLIPGVGTGSGLYHMLVGIGLLGLIASFHGIIMVAGRATYEFGRVGYAPAFLGKISAKTGTPVWALLANLVIGIAALYTGKTGELLTIVAFAALTLYIVAMIALFALRVKEPTLPRPYRTPGYPVVPAVALIIAVVSLGALTWYNLFLAGVYVAMLAVGYAWYFVAHQLGTVVSHAEVIGTVEEPALETA